MANVHTRTPKYRQIVEELRDLISSGKYAPGERLPSESDLVQQYGTSRVTVGRALRELQMAGLIDRRAGSGSFACAPSAPASYTFGLFIPELGRTEIFEPICRGMAEAKSAGHHTLLWGKSLGDSTEGLENVESVCQQFIAKKVAGVFFAPLELTPEKDATNRRIADTFDKADIPIVLLDRDLVAYPERSRYDLVGIDNRRAGYAITAHLLSVGAKKPLFIGRPGSAPTVDARIAGFREAVLDRGLSFSPDLVSRIDPRDQNQIRRAMDAHPDAIVCANDFTAAQVMHALNDLGVVVPDQVMMAGIDDVKYASLLSVPLTTIHQPCDVMGEIAIETMVYRLQHPTVPARDVMLNFTLVVRRSSGATANGAPTAGR